LTYAQLNAKANQLAHYLRTLGVGPEVLVGLCVGRSLEMVVGLLGILKAGGAYVPLDPTYPKERLAFLVSDTRAPVLVTQRRLREALPENDAEVVCLDTAWHVISQQTEENPAHETTAENLAYVIYTSGSTGQPKGVAIEHRSTASLLAWAQQRFEAAELAGVLASTSICFDLSVFELFLPLGAGGTVILAENVLQLPRLPAAGKVTLVNTVPSAIAALVREGGIPASVRTVCLAGEPLSTALVAQVYQAAGVQRVYDLYGPSEDTTYSTCSLRSAQGPATIGRPIVNTQIYLLDRHLQPVPIGVPGEIHLGGDGLARGYLNQPALTAEKFIPDLFGSQPGACLYKTGDLARYLPDGNIEFLGRLDQQIKLRGFRIETGEIKIALEQHPAIREAVVLAREDTPEEKRLVAYLVLHPAASLPTDELRHYLAAKLPEYMLPAAFVRLEALPVTPNGKLDRRALPAPAPTRPELDTAFAAPRGPVEEGVAAIWAEVLGLKQVGVHDDFFALGGHSLLATQVIARVRRTFHVEVPLRRLFEAPRVAELATAVTQTLGQRSERQTALLLAMLEQSSEEELAVRLSEQE
jgi:amino acid adenylation domain-containing protein